MKLTAQRQVLRPRHRFATSQGGITEKETIVVELEHDGLIGLGEIAPSALYGQSLEASEEVLAAAVAYLGNDPFAIRAIVSELLERFDSQRAAVAGIDSALHDWVARCWGVPVWRLLGLAQPDIPTTFTIGIAELDEVATKVDEALAGGFRALKVKVGTDHDHDVLGLIRSRFDGPLFLDANQAWAPDVAVQRVRALARYEPAVIEQPVPMHAGRAMAALRGQSSAAIIADESCQRPADVLHLRDVVDGVNIKLTKCGGIFEALRMIGIARTCGLRVMLGCFVSSSLAIAPALAIAGLVDWADLDGHLLLEDDPFTGISCAGGMIGLGHTAGLGVGAR